MMAMTTSNSMSVNASILRCFVLMRCFRTGGRLTVVGHGAAARVFHGWI
jgi:hypothetical protein